MSSFDPIIFLEKSKRIRSLFDSFLGMEGVENPLINCDSEELFWSLKSGRCALLIIDARLISGEIVVWLERLAIERPEDLARVIWVVETKEERDRLVALGIQNVMRLPFQWSQWLSVIKKMGLRWNLWSRGAK